MSWTPFDYEAEERRDSERFANGRFDDGPDPSEYLEMEFDDKVDSDGMPWQIDPTSDAYWDKFLKVGRKLGIIDENAMLKGLLVLLFAVLASLMLWILVGAAVMRWIL